MASISELRKQMGREKVVAVTEIDTATEVSANEEVFENKEAKESNINEAIFPKEEETEVLVHYEGGVGTFDYNPKLWKIKEFEGGRGVLKYIGPVNCPIDLPKGVTSTAFMFDSIIFEEGAYLRDFDTSEVTTMAYMFARAELCPGFTLGANFDTSNVKHMAGMFESAVLNDDFSLGDKFDTSKCESFNNWMTSCRMNKSFSMGDKFVTTAAKQARGMFMDCRFSSLFRFPETFKVDGIEEKEKEAMFRRQRGLQGLMGVETPEEVIAEHQVSFS